MEVLLQIGDALKYVQDHGGILFAFVVSVMYIEIRLHHKIDDVDRRAKNRHANHETYYHNLQLRQNKKGAE